MGANATAPVLNAGLVSWEGLFSQAELDAIERHGDALRQNAAELSHGALSGIRITRVAWYPRAAETEALYRRMEELVLALNARFFRYDLSGLVPFQYAVYDAAEQGHFDWHKDYGRDYDGGEPRKLTLSLQLSDPGAYDGCNLEVRAGNEVAAAPRGRGTLVAFPAWALHRVTPISRGQRKSLVIWAAGPDFR